jgi:hypothetical protein
VGSVKLKNKKIRQSNGMRSKLSKRPIVITAPSPTPILIKFLSKKFSEFLIKNVAVYPNPKV